MGRSSFSPLRSRRPLVGLVAATTLRRRGARRRDARARGHRPGTRESRPGRDVVTR